jgi:hypothetical protein
MLGSVAKKKGALQIVTLCRETSGRKKSDLFTKAGFRIICGQLG